MIYLLKQNNLYKIGFTDNLQERIRFYKTHNNGFEILYSLDGDKTKERELHKTFNKYKIYSEWFLCSDEITNYFKTNGTQINYNSNCLLVSNNSFKKLQILKPPTINVMFYLFTKIDFNNNVNVNIEEIINECGFSKSSIFNSLKILKENNFITKLNIGTYKVNNNLVKLSINDEEI